MCQRLKTLTLVVFHLTICLLLAGAYVCSQNKRFIAANYGKKGDAFYIDGQRPKKRLPRMTPIKPKNRRGSSSAPSSGGSTRGRSADGRIIRIVNADDHSISERVLLNLKTTQGIVSKKYLHFCKSVNFLSHIK